MSTIKSGHRLAGMQDRRLWKAGMAIGLAAVVVWLYWVLLFGPDRLNAPFF